MITVNYQRLNDDLTTKAGIQRATAEAKSAARLNGRRVLLWVSIPCTGGSSWARLNRSLGIATQDKIDAHIKVMMVLWNNLAPVANIVLDAGGRIAFEWPQSCDYWNFPEATSCLAKWRLKNTVFHGCMYGLVSIRPKHLGVPIKKPWRIATNCDELREQLCRCCDRSHQHVLCEGADTRVSEEYTDSMAQSVHRAFLAYCNKLSVAQSVVPAAVGIFQYRGISYDIAMPCIEISSGSDGDADESDC